MIRSPAAWAGVTAITCLSVFVWLSSVEALYPRRQQNTTASWTRLPDLVNDLLASSSHSHSKEGDDADANAVHGPLLSKPQQSFADFLTAASDSNDLIWITLADVFFSKTCTPHLQHFVKHLEPYKPSQKSAPARNHRLITLCIDPGCMDTCRDRGWTCYGEYEATRPDIIFPATWPKLRGMIDTLESGRDAIFVDSDVFFKSNPLDRIDELGSYDLQIQDEAVDGNVNTGFFHITPSNASIAHWQGVLDMDMEAQSRDQHNTNILLGSAKLRQSSPGEGPAPNWQQTFHSQNGLNVNVISPHDIYAHHFSVSWPSLAATGSIGAAAWHGTCLERRELKYLMPRENGFWQDVDEYYSSPPDLLVLPVLSGNPEEVLRQFSMFAAIAVATNRSMVPPAEVTVLLNESESVRRGLFSVFPMDELVFARELPILESHYIAHALPYHTQDSAVSSSLLEVNRLDVGSISTLDELIETLLRPRLKSHKVITLANWTPCRIAGTVPPAVTITDTCKGLREPIGCDKMCRR